MVMGFVLRMCLAWAVATCATPLRVMTWISTGFMAWKVDTAYVGSCGFYWPWLLFNLLLKTLLWTQQWLLTGFGFILAGILIGYLVTSWLLLRIVAYAPCEIIGVEGYESTYFSLVWASWYSARGSLTFSARQFRRGCQ